MTRRDDYDDNDDVRDAHLVAALRHAPDRDALPPREVSERILAAARAAVRPAPAVPWWQRVGVWLVRPQVAASFGTLVVVSIVGLMWSTREPPVDEPALRQSAAEPAAATSAVASTAASAAPVPAEVGRDERDLLALKIPTTPSPKQETTPRRAKEAKAPAAKAEARPAPAPGSDAMAESMAASEGSAAPAAAPVAQPGNTCAADAAVTAAAGADAAKTSRQRAAAAPVPALESSSRQALATASSAATGADPLTRIDALLARGRAAWGSDQRVMPHAAAQAAWWAQLRLATAGGWRRMPSQAHDIVAPPRSTWLTLFEADVRHVSIDLGSDSVQLCLIEQHACWRAPITAAQHDAWIAEVARW